MNFVALQIIGVMPLAVHENVLSNTVCYCSDLPYWPRTNRGVRVIRHSPRFIIPILYRRERN